MTQEYILEHVDCRSCDKYRRYPATQEDPEEHVCVECDFGQEGICDSIESAIEDLVSEDERCELCGGHSATNLQVWEALR